MYNHEKLIPKTKHLIVRFSFSNNMHEKTFNAEIKTPIRTSKNLNLLKI